MDEIERLKIKCNSYAKRLVLEGYDDVVWEVAERTTSDNSEYMPPTAKSCRNCKHNRTLACSQCIRHSLWQPA